MHNRTLELSHGCIKLKVLRLIVNAKPDLYLYELLDSLESYFPGIDVSASTIWRTLGRMGYSVKELSRRAIERNEATRMDFLLRMQQYHQRQLIFFDESSYDRRISIRKYGRAPSGLRAPVSAFFVRGIRYSVAAALGLDGYIATSIQEGGLNAQDVYDFFADALVSALASFAMFILTAPSSLRLSP